MPTAAPERVRKRDIVAKCRHYERWVRDRKLATEEELAEYRPASRAAREWDWVWYLCQLIRFVGRQELKPLDTQEADRLMLQALTGAPGVVECTDGRRFQVYPKSLEALLHFEARDRLLEWLAVRYAVLQESQTAEDLELLQRLARELAYQNSCLVWMATHEGPGLPYDWDGDGRPELPPEYRTLEPWDVLRIHRVFLDVNVARLQALERLIQPVKGDGPGTRLSWGVFVGSLAMRWKVEPRRLMRDHALVTLLAMTKAAAPAPSGPEEFAEELG